MLIISNFSDLYSAKIKWTGILNGDILLSEISSNSLMHPLKSGKNL